VKFCWILYAKWNIWHTNFNCAFVFALAALNNYILFLQWQHNWHLQTTSHCIYAMSCLCIPVSNAVTEWTKTTEKRTMVFVPYAFETVLDVSKPLAVALREIYRSAARMLRLWLGVPMSSGVKRGEGALGPGRNLLGGGILLINMHYEWS